MAGHVRQVLTELPATSHAAVQFVKLQEERSVRVDFVNEDPGIYVTLNEVRQMEPLATKNAMMRDARKTKVQNAQKENVLEVHTQTEMAD